jgi:hypothetical protein
LAPDLPKPPPAAKPATLGGPQPESPKASPDERPLFQRLSYDTKLGLIGVASLLVVGAVLALVVVIARISSSGDSSGGDVIRDAAVGDCLHVVTDYATANADGSHPIKVSKATCGTSDATDRVTLRTTDPGNCRSSVSGWVRSESPSPSVVLCLEHL